MKFCVNVLLLVGLFLLAGCNTLTAPLNEAPIVNTHVKALVAQQQWSISVKQRTPVNYQLMVVAEAHQEGFTLIFMNGLGLRLATVTSVENKLRVEQQLSHPLAKEWLYFAELFQWALWSEKDLQQAGILSVMPTARGRQISSFDIVRALIDYKSPTDADTLVRTWQGEASILTTDYDILLRSQANSI